MRAWLLAIARRVAADQLRTARVRPQIDPDVAVEDAPGACGRADLGESVVLHAVLDGLDPDRRLAFPLTQLLGLSYLEAAQVCDRPVGTIRSRVARARDDLVAELADDDLPDRRRHRGGS